VPLLFDDSALSPEVLRALHRSLREDLEGTVALTQAPPETVRDPASIETASELLRTTLALLNLPGPRTEAALRAEVNLAYSTLLAVIDLIKSHTDVPRVPRARPKT